MAVDPFEKKIYSLIAWKSLQEKSSFNPRANEVIALNEGIRRYIATHPPLRQDGIHPYVRCRRRCIYSVLPHPVPAYEKPLYDDFQDLPPIRSSLKPFRPSGTTPSQPDRKRFVTRPTATVATKSLEQDDDHFCSVWSGEEFPLVGDSKKKGTFEYWKKLAYDEEISARQELAKAWNRVSSIQQGIVERQDAELEKVLKRKDGTILNTSLYSPVFYPSKWAWKPEKLPKHSKKILLKFDTTSFDSLGRKKAETSTSNELLSQNS